MNAREGAPSDRAQAVLTINLSALQDNWRLLRDQVAPAVCAAVVKADAYGIGLAPAARALYAAGCKDFFVAHIDEGARLRAALPDERFRAFVLNGLAAKAAHAEACAQFNLIPLLENAADAALWSDQATRSDKPLPAAIMFDTGMNRLGYDWRAAEDVANWFRARPQLAVALVNSHFVSSERPTDPINEIQIARFDKARRSFPTCPASFANSSAHFLPQRPFLDLTRPGYALYGGNPTPGAVNPMRPVVRLEAEILQIRDVEPGETVGYNGQWTAKRRSRLAAIGVGYGDGVPRNAMATDEQPGAEAVVAGIRCPFAGRVSMDLIMVDVTEVPEAALAGGPPAELLGDVITVDDLGARARTIGYEILTSLGRRYAREYVETKFGGSQ